MKRVAFGFAVLGLAALALVAVSAAAEEEAMAPGHEAFASLKCNMCHAVSSAGIEAKTKSEKMFGGDLVNLAGEWDAEKMRAYINREIEVDGKEHKKEFKGSDEELQAIVDWLLEQKAEG